MTRTSGLLRSVSLGLVCLAIATSASGQDAIYVTSNDNSLLIFNRTDSGPTAPLATVVGGSTGFSGTEKASIDTRHEQIVVANATSNAVTVHTIYAENDTAPALVIGGAAAVNTLLNQPDAVFVDVLHDEIFVTSNAAGASEAVRVFNRTPGGDVAPKRSLIGANTGILDPQGIWVDLVNNELYVANGQGDSIVVFSRTASGNTLPIRTLVGATTQLAQPEGILVDNVHDELIVANNGGVAPTGITVYRRIANGDEEPIRHISGTATGFGVVEDVALDLAHNELFVLDDVGSVRVFARNDSGNVKPIRVLEGVATGLVNPQGIEVIPWIFADDFELGNPTKWSNF